MATTNNELLNKYYELGELITRITAYQNIIQTDVDTTLETADGLDDCDTKFRFLGKCYYELVDDLKKAGIIK